MKPIRKTIFYAIRCDFFFVWIIYEKLETLSVIEPTQFRIRIQIRLARVLLLFLRSITSKSCMFHLGYIKLYVKYVVVFIYAVLHSFKLSSVDCYSVCFEANLLVFCLR